MKTLWIGLRAEVVLCGSESGRDTIDRMGNGALMRFSATALHAIRADGDVIGYGIVCARYPKDDAIPVDTDELQSRVERVRRAFGLRGIGGPFTINIEETDAPRIPLSVPS